MFDEPVALLSAAPAVLGIDGARMSKTRGNTIPLGAGEDETAAMIRAARTDALRHITFDPHGATTGGQPADHHRVVHRHATRQASPSGSATAVPPR